MAKKNRRNRRKEKRAAYGALKATPTYFVRLTPVVVVIDPGRRWFVVRTIAQRERAVAERLQEIALTSGVDFTVYRATEAVSSIRRGRAALREGYPAAGYLFIGMNSGETADDDRTILRSLSDGEVFTYRDELFRRIMGPFDPSHLQRFAGKVKPPPMLELCHTFNGRVAMFPVRVPFPGGYRADLTSVMTA